MADIMSNVQKRKRTEEEIEHEQELLVLSYITLLNMCDDMNLSRSGKKADLVKRLMDPDSYRVKVRDSYLTSDKVMNIQKVPEILEKLGVPCNENSKKWMYSLGYTSEEIETGVCTVQDLFQLFIGFNNPSAPVPQIDTSHLSSNARSKKKVKKLKVLELNKSQPPSSSAYVSKSLQRSLGQTVVEERQNEDSCANGSNVRMVDNEASHFRFPLEEVVVQSIPIHDKSDDNKINGEPIAQVEHTGTTCSTSENEKCSQREVPSEPEDPSSSTTTSSTSRVAAHWNTEFQEMSKTYDETSLTSITEAAGQNELLSGNEASDDLALDNDENSTDSHVEQVAVISSQKETKKSSKAVKVKVNAKAKAKAMKEAETDSGRSSTSSRTTTAKASTSKPSSSSKKVSSATKKAAKDTVDKSSATKKAAKDTVDKSSATKKAAKDTVDTSSATKKAAKDTVDTSSATKKAAKDTVDKSMGGMFQIKDGHPDYPKDTKFYVKLMTWYNKKSECPFPNPDEWYVEGVVKAPEKKGAHKVCFPVFGKDVLCYVPSYFKKHANFTPPSDERIVTSELLAKYEGEEF